MNDSAYMSLALQLARRRKGLTHPNPTVGAVVVSGGEIVGLGYHERAGYPHAEVVALEQAGEKVRGSTLYVSLEPCSHFGRTPPCTDTIIRSGVKRVVVGTTDPNPLVGGKGIEKLRSEGIEVEVGVLEKEAQELNEDFFTFIKEKRPYVTLKFAQTLNGKLASASGDSKWISSIQSRKYAHRLRAEATAVLVGVNTVIRDDPLLTVRYFPFERQPIRIVIDPEFKVPLSSKLIQDRSASTLVIFCREDPQKENTLRELGVELIRLESIDLKYILRELALMDIVHILVEGGAYTINQFLKEDLWDRMVVFQAPKLIGDGISVEYGGAENMSDALRLKCRREIKIGEDRLMEFVKGKEEKGLRW